MIKGIKILGCLQRLQLIENDILFLKFITICHRQIESRYPTEKGQSRTIFKSDMLNVAAVVLKLYN
jgi:hypothetical protein